MYQPKKILNGNTSAITQHSKPHTHTYKTGNSNIFGYASEGC